MSDFDAPNPQNDPDFVTIAHLSRVLNSKLEDGSGTFPDHWDYRKNATDAVPEWINDSAIAYSGNRCLKIVPSGARVNCQVFQTKRIRIPAYKMVQVACFTKFASANGSNATCNCGIQAIFTDDGGNVVLTSGTLSARSSDTDGPAGWVATNTIGIFENTVGATHVQFALGISSLSSNMIVYLDSFQGFPVPSLQIMGSSGRVLNQDSSGNSFFIPTPSASMGGWSKTKYSPLSNTVQTLKATAGVFGGYRIENKNSATIYLQIFDVATGTPVTLGTTVPDDVVPILDGSMIDAEYEMGLACVNGIKVAITTEEAGNVAVSIPPTVVLRYK